MVILPLDEAAKLGIADIISINTVTNTAQTGEVGVVYSYIGSVINQDKISKALGFTHYVKKGKLFRK